MHKSNFFFAPLLLLEKVKAIGSKASCLASERERERREWEPTYIWISSADLNHIVQGDPKFEGINMIVAVEEETKRFTFRFSQTWSAEF